MSGSLLAATHGPTAYWYLTRGTGIVALVLLTAVIVLGVGTSLGWTSARWPRFFSQALHRDLSLFCVVLIVVHVVTTVMDGFAPIGYLDSIVPFRSPYRPLWLGFGALSFDLFIVLCVTSALRWRMGYRSWKLIHWLAYACWPVAVLHGLGTGTDSRLGVILAINALCVGVVVVAVGYRLAAGWPTNAGRRVLGAGAASAFCLALGLFVFLGPFRPDWSRRAGTPTALLSGASSAAQSGPSQGAGAAPAPPTSGNSSQPGSSGSPSSLPTAPFRATLAGSFTNTPADAAGHVTVDIRGRLSGGANLPIDVVLRGTQEGEGVSLTSSHVTLGPGTGEVIGLEGDTVVAVVNAGSSSLRLTMQLSLDQSTGQFQGVAQGAPGGAGSDSGEGFTR
jgi:sulfoxide reductase heme-binding subunit YedZ